MKTNPKSVPSVGLHSLAFLLLASAVFAAPSQPEAKPYVLFMGASVCLKDGTATLPVQTREGKSFILQDGASTRKKAIGDCKTLTLTPSLTLSEHSVMIENLTCSQSSSEGNAKMREAMSTAVGISNSNADAAARTNEQARSAAIATSVQKETPTLMPGASGLQGPISAPANYGIATTGSVNFTDILNEGMTGQDLDTIEVAFKVTSAKPLPNAYAILIVKFHLADKPSQLFHWAEAQPLTLDAAKPVKVRFAHSGFPKDMRIDSTKIHVYDGQSELATNLADNRVSITRDEAFQFLVIDHISTHKGASIPAKPVLTRVSTSARNSLTPDQLKRSFRVKVGKDGMPQASADVDEGVAAILNDLRFLPALKEGTAVESTVEVSMTGLMN